jgi:hypothetical protein
VPDTDTKVAFIVGALSRGVATYRASAGVTVWKGMDEKHSHSLWRAWRNIPRQNAKLVPWFRLALQGAVHQICHFAHVSIYRYLDKICI